MQTSVRRAPLAALALTLAALCIHAEPAASQIVQPRAEPRSDQQFCWQGRPIESCRTFLLAEGGAHMLLAGSRYTRNEYGNRGTTRSAHLVGHVNWEIGVMANRGAAEAVGVAVLVGGDANGLRLGLKGRYRRWMGRDAALDIGAGVLATQRAAPFEGAEADRPGNRHVMAGGLTGDAALGLTDWASLSVRGDLVLDADGSLAHGVYGGLRLGTRPAAVATLAPLVLGLAAVLVVGAGG